MDIKNTFINFIKNQNPNFKGVPKGDIEKPEFSEPPKYTTQALGETGGGIGDNFEKSTAEPTQRVGIPPEARYNNGNEAIKEHKFSGERNENATTHALGETGGNIGSGEIEYNYDTENNTEDTLMRDEALNQRNEEINQGIKDDELSNSKVPDKKEGHVTQSLNEDGGLSQNIFM